MITVFSCGNNQEDPLFRQASQIFRIAAHLLSPHANGDFSIFFDLLKMWQICEKKTQRTKSNEGKIFFKIYAHTK